MGIVCDFSGWATKNDLKCSDGRVIRKGAFKHNDGQMVPLVWNHQHGDVEKILGHALLENRDEGVYAYCTFNNTEAGQNAKKLVMHGDITALSIYANHLQQKGSDVLHGVIRELSLVLAGANPEAFIDYVCLEHGDIPEESLIVKVEEPFELSHAEDNTDNNQSEDPINEPEVKHAEPEQGEDNKSKTVEDVYNSLSQEQKDVVHAMIAQAIQDNNSEDPDDENENIKHSEGGDNFMKNNAFDQDQNQQQENVLSHAEMMEIVADAKRTGSMKDAVLAHGIEQIDFLFPYGEGDGKNVTNTPIFIQRDMGWVQKIMRGVHHTPFSRVKSLFANITEDEARAKGYIKGKQKKEEVFAILKRSTGPQTVYKLQKIDRDDIIDITDFEVVGFIKGEMRIMLDEEIARAILIGDGRPADAEEKIKEDCIRPIWKDDDLYSIKATVTVAADATLAQVAEELIDEAVRARVDYTGSGSPTAFMPEDMVTAALLLKDRNGRRIYKDVTELATAMMVKEIVPVPVMKGLTRTDSEGNTRTLRGIIVNMNDYNIGADKGGSVNMFDDFDINFNKYEYLIETRCSGALIKPKAAIVLETVVAP